MSNSVIYINNSGVIQLVGLKNHLGAYQNDATVQLTALVDRASGDTPSNITLPIDLDYRAGTDGDYEGLLPYNAILTVGQILEATVVATDSQGHRGEFTEICRVKRRVV